MKLSQIKNKALWWIIALGLVGAINKYSDALSNDLYDNLIATHTNVDNKANPNRHGYFEYQKLNTKDLKEKQDGAINQYRKNSYPVPDYETDDEFLRDLTEIRIETSLHPGQHCPTGIEEYSHEVLQKQGTNALCATGTISQLRKSNIWSQKMRELFAMEGKDTRKLAQLLGQHGWKSIAQTVDQSSYYNERQTNNGRLPEHYDQVLRAATTVPANAILTARYSQSGRLWEAQQSNKNATHSLRSLGSIKQDLTRQQLGISKEVEATIRATQGIEQTVMLLYHLLYQRDFTHAVGSYSQEVGRLTKLLQQYPNLIKTEITEDGVIFEGTMVSHVYPTWWVPTNYIHYIAELVGYRGNNKDGSLFLICDGLIAGEKALKHDIYQNISPLYHDINNLRSSIKKWIPIESTYILNFEEIDRNNNKIIDKHDKHISDMLNEMSIKWHQNHAQDYGLSEKETKNYLIKYWTILGLIDNFPTGTIIPIPNLETQYCTLIDSIYESYLAIDKQFRKESRDQYYDYLSKTALPAITSNKKLQNSGYVLYPTLRWDDEITITEQICKWIDIINQHNDQITIKTQLHQLGGEEIQKIHNIIKPAIEYKTATLQANQHLHINLAQAISLLQNYLYNSNMLETNYLPETPHPVFDKFEEVMDKMNISESNNAIMRHYLLRETSGQIWFFDIAKWRSWNKYMAEIAGFDNMRKNIKEVSSQGPFQLRLKYFTKGQKEEINKIYRACENLVQNKEKLNITEKNVERLNHLMNLCQDILLLIPNQEENTVQKDLFELQEELLKELSKIVDFNSHSIEHPDENLGTLISIGITNQQLNKYKYKQSELLCKLLDIQKLTPDHINFLQEFAYITHHYGLNKGNEHLKQAINTYQSKKRENPDYKLSMLSSEPALKHIFHYINTLPPQSNDLSAHARFAMALLWSFLLLYSQYNKKQQEEVNSDDY